MGTLVMPLSHLKQTATLWNPAINGMAARTKQAWLSDISPRRSPIEIGGRQKLTEPSNWLVAICEASVGEGRLTTASLDKKRELRCDTVANNATGPSKHARLGYVYRARLIAALDLTCIRAMAWPNIFKSKLRSRNDSITSYHMAVRARFRLVRAFAAFEDSTPECHDQSSTATAFGHPHSYFRRTGIARRHAYEWKDYILGKPV